MRQYELPSSSCEDWKRHYRMIWWQCRYRWWVGLTRSLFKGWIWPMNTTYILDDIQGVTHYLVELLLCYPLVTQRSASGEIVLYEVWLKIRNVTLLHIYVCIRYREPYRELIGPRKWTHPRLVLFAVTQKVLGREDAISARVDEYMEESDVVQTHKAKVLDHWISILVVNLCFCNSKTRGKRTRRALSIPRALGVARRFMILSSTAIVQMIRTRSFYQAGYPPSLLKIKQVR